MATYGHGRAAPWSAPAAAAPAAPPVRVLTPDQVTGAIGAAARTLTLLAPGPPTLGKESPEMRGALRAARAGVTVRVRLGGHRFEELVCLEGRLAVSWCPVALPALTVVDGERLVAALDGEGCAKGALLIRSASWAAMIERWAEGDHREGGASVALDRGDRTVLELLRAGLTDEQAARRMGMSTRTYRRRVANLLRRLSAKNRFQAGYRLAQLGLEWSAAEFAEQTQD
ncbi:helix-turn-helix transcriptional regulator [Streptomyces peucetius]|nr:hypothetical protein CGZ69_25295 [Streptomyces peucetius subsp. caesius ATCC 27952]